MTKRNTSIRSIGGGPSVTHHSTAEREDRVGQNKHHHRHGTMILTRNRAKAKNGGSAESQAVESHVWFRGGEGRWR